MKQIPFLLLITIGMVACGLSSTPKPAPVVEVAPAPVVEEVAKVTSPGCHCNVCNCTVCKCETVTDGPTPLTEEEFEELKRQLRDPKPEAKVEQPVSTVVKPLAAQPVTRTTYGQQYSSCGPNGCPPARSFRIFRGRR